MALARALAGRGLLRAERRLARLDGAAQAHLAVSLLQRGESGKADVALRALGFTHRLGAGLWKPCRDQAVATPDGDSGVIVLDEWLPQTLVEALARGFASGSPFWAAHDYPPPTFFSYWFPGDSTARHAVEQAATVMRPAR